MERAEDIKRIEAVKTGMADKHSPKPRKLLGGKPVTGKRRPDWWDLAILALQVTILVVVILLVRGLGREGRGQRAVLTTEVESLNRELEAADEKIASVAGEVADLNQFLASQTARDIILLKILILSPDIDQDLARAIAGNLHHYAEVYGQDPDLALAIMAIESNFKPEAVSSAGAIGLMQVMPQWKKVLGIKQELNEVETSIKYGLVILNFYREMYKDLEMALTAYNRGPGPVDMALMRGRDPRNDYAAKVLKVHRRLQELRIGEW